MIDFYKRSIWDKIDRGFADKIYEYNNQLQILAKDRGVNRLNIIIVNKI